MNISRFFRTAVVTSTAVFCVSMGVAASSIPANSQTTSQTNSTSKAMGINPDDRIATVLERTRLRYESSMERLRTQVWKAIAKEKREANKRGQVDSDRLNKAEAAEKAFAKRGAWPDLPQIVTMQNQAAETAVKMRDGYGRALTAYDKASKEDLRVAIGRELSAFEDHSDIIPWSENRLPADGLRELTDGGALSIPLEFATEYRIEIKAKRLDEGASLVVSLPFSKGNAIEFSVTGWRGSRVIAMVTVRNGFLGLDAGVIRPADHANAVPDANTASVVLVARGGSIEIESVRVKRVISGKPEQVRIIDPYPRWQVGSRWINHAPDEGNEIWTVTERKDDRITIMRQSKWSNNGQVYLDLLIGHNGRLSITRVHRANVPRPIADRGWQGRGSIRPNSMRFRFSLESVNTKKKISRWGQTLDLKPE